VLVNRHLTEQETSHARCNIHARTRARVRARLLILSYMVLFSSTIFSFLMTEMLIIYNYCFKRYWL